MVVLLFYFYLLAAGGKDDRLAASADLFTRLNSLSIGRLSHWAIEDLRSISRDFQSPNHTIDNS
jgi:hypothetical protein